MVTELAHAKINLYLDVTSRRKDGFHNIKTVMHSVSLSDTLEVSAQFSETPEYELRIIGNDSLSVTDNLVIDAARAYMEEIGVRAHIKITLEKNIPVSAGLAGGSADAAATLRALNRIFGVRLSADELWTLALKIGSDVPYCLNGGTALCEGRGELITPYHAPRAMNFVIAVANECVSTPKAYARLDAMYSDFATKNSEAEALAELEEFFMGAPLPRQLYNVFEDAVLPECPGAAAIKEEMLSVGARLALMSGSGPSVFGIFESSEEAERCRTHLLSLGYRAYCAVSA